MKTPEGSGLGKVRWTWWSARPAWTWSATRGPRRSAPTGSTKAGWCSA